MWKIQWSRNRTIDIDIPGGNRLNVTECHCRVLCDVMRMLLIINGCYHLPQSDRRSSCRQLFCCVWDASGSKHCLGADWSLRSCAWCRPCQTSAWRHSCCWRRGGRAASWASWSLSSWPVSLMSLWSLLVADWLVWLAGVCIYDLWSVCVSESLTTGRLSRPVQATVGEWMVCLSLSLSRLCSRPGPVARCRPEPSSARGRHIGGQQRMVSTSAPRSHQGQALNKQGVSVRRPGSGDSSDFHFRRTMLSRGKTENMGPGETGVGTLRGPASWGAASDFEDLIRDHNRGVNELHFHIRLCCVIRILIWPQPLSGPARERRIGPTWLRGLAPAAAAVI